jgi:hypothetical protein
MNTTLFGAFGFAAIGLLLATDASGQSRGFGSGGSGLPSIGAPSARSGPMITPPPSLSPRITTPAPIIQPPPSRVPGPGMPRPSSGTTSYYKNTLGTVPMITSPASRTPGPSDR